MGIHQRMALQSFQLEKKKPTAYLQERNRTIPGKNVLIVAWTGTRGVISMAAALALPLTFITENFSAKTPYFIFMFCSDLCNLSGTGILTPALDPVAWRKAIGQRGKRRKRTTIICGELHTAFYRL